MTVIRFLAIFTFSTLLSLAEAKAQSLKDLFLHMPQSVCPILTEYNRLELVDNQANGKQMRTTNAMQSTSSMERMTESIAILKTTSNSEKTFKLLKRNDGQAIVAVVSTVYVDNSPDSHIEFYDSNWNILNGDSLMGIDQYNDFHYFALNESNNDLHVVCGNPLAIALDGSNKIVKAHTNTFVLTWNGEQFVEKAPVK